MKSLFILLFLTITSSLSAQNNFQIDLSKIDKDTKLVGRHPQYNKNSQYAKLNFIVENVEEIKNLLRKINYGAEITNRFDPNCFDLTLIQGDKEKRIGTIIPHNNSISFDGNTYRFDIGQIDKLNRKYPFDYRCDVKVFKSEKEYSDFLMLQKKDNSFLFDYDPDFRFEGSFEIIFPKNDQFPSPLKISEYLEPFINKIESDNNKYRVDYALKGVNVTNRNQYTMTITGSRKLYELLELSDKNLKKENWKYAESEGYFFYRVKK
jgi:hypothetical protein